MASKEYTKQLEAEAEREGEALKKASQWRTNSINKSHGHKLNFTKLKWAKE